MFLFFIQAYTFISSTEVQIEPGYKSSTSSCFLKSPTLLQKDPRKPCTLVKGEQKLIIPATEFSLQLLGSPRENPIKLQSSIALDKNELAKKIKGCTIVNIENLSSQTFLITVAESCIFKLERNSLIVEGMVNQEFIKNIFINKSLASQPIEDSPRRALASKKSSIKESLMEEPSREVTNLEEVKSSTKSPSVERKINSIDQQQLPKEEESPSFQPWNEPFESEKLIDFSQEENTF